MSYSIVDQLTCIASEIGSQHSPASCAFIESKNGKLILSMRSDPSAIRSYITYLTLLCSIKYAAANMPGAFASINALKTTPNAAAEILKRIVKELCSNMTQSRIQEGCLSIIDTLCQEPIEKLSPLELSLACEGIIFEIDTLWRETIFSDNQPNTAALKEAIDLQIEQSIFIYSPSSQTLTSITKTYHGSTPAYNKNKAYNAALQDWAFSQFQSQSSKPIKRPPIDQPTHPDMDLLDHLIKSGTLKSHTVYISKSGSFNCEAIKQTVLNLTQQTPPDQNELQNIDIKPLPEPSPLPDSIIDLLESDPKIKALNLDPQRTQSPSPLHDSTQFYQEYTRVCEKMGANKTVCSSTLTQIINMPKECRLPIISLGAPISTDPRQGVGYNASYDTSSTKSPFITKTIKPHIANHTEEPSLLAEGTSIVLDFVPVIGTAKSVVETITGKDAVTGERINRWVAAGGIALSLIPFGKILTRGKKGEKLAAKLIEEEKRTAKKAALKEQLTREVFLSRSKALMSGEIPAVNITPIDVHTNYKSIGRYQRTFITSERYLNQLLGGELKKGSATLRLPKSYARSVEEGMGLSEGAFKDGGYITFVHHVPARDPKLPTKEIGNEFYVAGHGLDGINPKTGQKLVAGPEATIEPVFTVKSLPQVPLGQRQIKILFED